jgi:hypothetical protein
VRDVLDRVEAEAVDAEPLRPGELGVEEVLRDLGVLGPEVGEAGDARRDVVRSRSPPSRSSGTSPSSPGPSCSATRTRVVVDDVEEDADAARVARLHERDEVVFRAEARVEGEEVVGPVAVVGPVGEAAPR